MPNPSWIPVPWSPVPGDVLPWLADPLLTAGTLTRMVAAVSVGALPVANALPWRMRMVLAAAVAAVALPLAATSRPARTPAEPGLVALVGEAVVGGVLGTSVAAVVAAAGWAGRLLGRVSGLSWADDFTPEAGDEFAGSARLAWWLGVGGFLAAGGHLAVIGGLVDSVRSLPVPVACGNDGGEVMAALNAVIVRMPSVAIELAMGVSAAALAAVTAFHVGIAICLRTVRFTPGEGLLQGLAAVVVLATLAWGADSWCTAFGTVARSQVEQSLRLEVVSRP